MMRFGPVLSACLSFFIIAAVTPVRAETPMADPGQGMEYADEAQPTAPKAKMPTKKSSNRISRADAFIAKADWEFDGFVAGGQDLSVRSMYYLNDLVYLNIGTEQGVEPGSRIVIYKRGKRVRDPQTGRPMGYEVRRAAISRATDQVDDKTCSVRILDTYEAVEIGDLVRRE